VTWAAAASASRAAPSPTPARLGRDINTAEPFAYVFSCLGKCCFAGISTAVPIERLQLPQQVLLEDSLMVIRRLRRTMP